jgi:hypothetical protein
MLQALQAESTESYSKGDAELLAIPPDGIETVWPIARAQLALAASWTRKVDLDVLKTRLQAGIGQLWMVWVPKDELSLATICTDLLVHDTGWKVARVTLIGGGGMDIWRSLLVELEQWAREEGCDAIELVGRKGWQRVYTDYEHCETLIVKEF